MDGDMPIDCLAKRLMQQIYKGCYLEKASGWWNLNLGNGEVRQSVRYVREYPNEETVWYSIFKCEPEPMQNAAQQDLVAAGYSDMSHYRRRSASEKPETLPIIVSFSNMNPRALHLIRTDEELADCHFERCLWWQYAFISPATTEAGNGE